MVALDFRQFRAADVQVRHVGPDRYPVMVIDAALKNPDAARALALSSRFFRPGRSHYYPGFEACCGAAGLSDGIGRIAKLFWRSVFGLEVDSGHDFADTVGRTFFACYAPQMDSKYINVHVDGMHKLAMVLHLSPDELETGTGYWRDAETGLQAFSTEDEASLHAAEKLYGCSYAENLRRALEAGQGRTRNDMLKSFMLERLISPPFPDTDHQGWSLLDIVPSRFNRAVIYPGWIFHSVVFPGYRPPGHIDQARITLNTFIDLPIPGRREIAPTVVIEGMQR